MQEMRAIELLFVCVHCARQPSYSFMCRSFDGNSHFSRRHIAEPGHPIHVCEHKNVNVFRFFASFFCVRLLFIHVTHCIAQVRT